MRVSCITIISLRATRSFKPRQPATRPGGKWERCTLEAATLLPAFSRIYSIDVPVEYRATSPPQARHKLKSDRAREAVQRNDKKQRRLPCRESRTRAQDTRRYVLFCSLTSTHQVLSGHDQLRRLFDFPIPRPFRQILPPNRPQMLTRFQKLELTKQPPSRLSGQLPRLPCPYIPGFSRKCTYFLSVL